MWQALSSLLFAILGYAAAIATEPIRRWVFQPSLKLNFEPTYGVGAKFISVTQTGQINVMYVRVAVKNEPRWYHFFSAMDCQAYLTRIEKRNLDGSFQTIHQDPLPLSWAYLGMEPVNIHPGMEFLFDVIAVNDASHCLEPQTSTRPFVWTDSLAGLTTYTFTMVVSAANAKPQRIKLEVDWKGKFELLQQGCFALVEN